MLYKLYRDLNFLRQSCYLIVNGDKVSNSLYSTEYLINKFRFETCNFTGTLGVSRNIKLLLETNTQEEFLYALKNLPEIIPEEFIWHKTVGNFTK